MKLTTHDKAVIGRMKAADQQWKDIAITVGQKLGICRDYYRIWKRDQSLPPKIILTDRILDRCYFLQIKNMIEKDSTMTLRQLSAGLDIKVTPKCVRLYLLRNNYATTPAARKIQLRDANIAKRAAVADLLFFKEPVFCYDVIWSDEVTVKLWPKNKSMSIWSKQSDPYKQKNIYKNVQQGGITVSCWGCFSSYSWGPIVCYEGTMGSHLYTRMMRKYLLPELAAAEENNLTMRFMQDGASCHF